MRLPPGTRDWLPADLRRKRAVESELRAVFERWAYAEVQTPYFERFDALEAGLGDDVASRGSSRRGCATRNSRCAFRTWPQPTVTKIRKKAACAR